MKILIKAICAYVCANILGYLWVHLFWADIFTQYKAKSVLGVIKACGCVGGWLAIGGVSAWVTYRKLKQARKWPVANNNVSRLLIGICVCLLLVLFQSWYQVHSLSLQTKQVSAQFKKGEASQSQWKGWYYYNMNSYYTQTSEIAKRQRIGHVSEEDMQNLMISLKNLHDGIVGVRNYILNHRMFFGMLELGFWSVGLLYVLLIIVGSICVIKMCNEMICGCCQLFVNLFLWLGCGVLTLMVLLTTSFLTLNTHSICLQGLNSSNVNIIIDKNWLDEIVRMKLGVKQDPYAIYLNICQVFLCLFLEYGRICSEMFRD